MRTEIDSKINLLFDFIDKLSTVKKHDWLSRESAEIYEIYQKLREDIKINSSKGNYFKECYNLALNYYNVAKIYNKYYIQHKIDLNIIKISLDKCLSKLSGIRATEKEISETEILFRDATTMKQIINNIYIDVEDQLYNTYDKLETAKYLVNLGHVDYENFNLSTRDFEFCHSDVLAICLINVISDIEEMFTLHADMDHYNKANLCKNIARAYELCGQHHIHDEYMNSANEYIQLILNEFHLKNKTSKKIKEIRKCIQMQVKDLHNTLAEVYEEIKSEFQEELNNLDSVYIEQEYIRCCCEGLNQNISKTLDRIAETNNKDELMSLISDMGQIKTLLDLQNCFTNNAYYKLLINHKNILKTDQEKQIIKQYKIDLWHKIYPKISNIQLEFKILKHIVIFLRSCFEDSRSIINQLELTKFCNGDISAQKLINNILSLQLDNNQDLINLKMSINEIETKYEFLFKKKFIEILENYVLPPQITIEEDVIIVDGRFIVLSEVLQDIIQQKFQYIKELRIIGADVFKIDASLNNEIWSSINILVASKTIFIKGKHLWDVSGRNGKEHQQAKAADSQEPGGNGIDGKDGQCGKSGGNVHISCLNIINSENLTIKSNGGNGSNGQSGGDGKKGNDGFGISYMEFESLSRQYASCDTFKIRSKIKTVDIEWSKELGRLNSCENHTYLTGKTENGCYLYYSYYPGVVVSNDEALILYKGTHAEAGGLGGQAGVGGSGGYCGDVIIVCNSNNVLIERKPGQSGYAGINGNNGPPGKNGWDMGCIISNDWFRDTKKKIIGMGENSKIEMKFHEKRVDENCVYIPYEYDVNKNQACYASLKLVEKDFQVITRNIDKTQKQEQATEAVRNRAISRSVIKQNEENIRNDVLDELTNLSSQIIIENNLKEQTLENMIEKEEEMEIQMIAFKTRRLAIFDDSMVNKEHKILKRKLKNKQISDNRLAIITEPELLKSFVFNLEDLKKLFKNPIYFTDLQIYKILLAKYKIVSCQEIEKKHQLPKIDLMFTPNAIEKYLVLDKITEKISYGELSILQDYFTSKDNNIFKNLQNFLQHLNVGLLLYPLKFFILEKCDKSNSSEISNKENLIIALENLNKLEKQLDTLIKCYFIAFDQNEKTTILCEIEKQKNELIKQFNLENTYEEIITEFSAHICNTGISSTAVRELLAIVYCVNIQIFIINQNHELILYHNHNPSSKQTVYFFLVNDQYVQFHIDENYVNLITTRKKLSKNYSNLLSYVNKFVCKKEFDELYNNFDLFNGYESSDNIYLEYSKLTETDLIQQVCNYFPKNQFTQIHPVINKLQSGYLENNNVLKAVLQRFDCEGRHVTLHEMIFLVDIILKSYLDKDADLELFEWIISVKPQSLWINELFYLELETFFKISLSNTNVYKYVQKVQQKDILLLMYIKLKEATDNVTLEYMTKCLNMLSEIEIDDETIKTLPLSKWQYTLREQLLKNKLKCLTTWNNKDELLRTSHYINCLEHNVGPDIIDELLKELQKKSEEISSKNCLKIFSLLRNQEWTLNKELINKISKNRIKTIEEEIETIQKTKNEERSLDIVMKLIRENLKPYSLIKNTLNDLENHPILSFKIDTPYSEENIRTWAKQFKKNMYKAKDKSAFINKNIVEIIKYILHAIKLKKGFELRIVQRLSILLMLYHNDNTLAQLETGEGKSIIIVTVSIFKALCGEKVDIITSSSVLAIRDATINKDIYDIFNVKVQHNCSEKLDDRRDAYSGCPVIFGDLSNYQRDYLLDRFYGKNILGDRNFDTILVDEVDNMLLDKGNNTLYLSHDIPGLDKLESVYQFIWKKVCMNMGQKQENFEKYLKKDVLYDLYGEIHIDDLVSNLNISNSIAKKLHAFWNIDNKNINLPNDLKPYEHKLNFMLNEVKKRKTEIKIPKFLYKFVENHIDTWIKNGLSAAIMEEGMDYVVDIDRTNTESDITPKITIIDKGTGTDQSNSQWEEGLHQFLQLKHGCKISPLSLKAVFISNVSYFQKYKRLFGITGTLGSQVERDLLRELYKVEFVNIPTAKPKKFIEHEPLLYCTKIDWQQGIVNRTKELIKANRSVLVICETIKEVNYLAKALRKANISDSNVIYKREYEKCLLAEGKEKLDCGKVIVATNLAGRGTDIKITDKLNEHGGIHVLVTYLPNSLRIQQQAFGRAARAGNNGSGQLVIIGYGSFMDKQEMREKQEHQRIADVKIYFDTRIKVEEKYFNKFNEIYKQCNNNDSVDNKIKEIASHRLLDRWAFLIDKYDTSFLENNFKQFGDELQNEYSKWDEWKDNTTYLIKIGLHFINKEEYNHSIVAFNKVIEQEPEFCEAAHYYKAVALGKCSYTTYTTEIVSELQKAKTLFEARKDICMISSTYVQSLKENMKNSFMAIDAYKNQQETMITLYNHYIQSINDILGYPVTKSSFISPEISKEDSEEIYDTFLMKSILTYAKVATLNSAVIKEISTSFGIPANILLNFLSPYENKDINEQNFVEHLKQEIRIPNLEECWDEFVKQKFLTNEKKLVMIKKSNLTTKQLNVLNSQVNINVEKSEGKYVLMKQYVEEDKDIFVFEESILESNKNLFDTLQKKNELVYNRIAELSKDLNTHSPIGIYDSLIVENFTSCDIEESEAIEILNKLCKENFLKKHDSSYVLVNEYDENKIPQIPAYERIVLQILRLNFAYRIALQNIQIDIGNVEEQVYLKVISQPHMILMWQLIDKNIIEPVYVKDHTLIQSKWKNNFQKLSVLLHVKSILRKHAGSLKSLIDPTFNLISITDSLDDIQASHFQELNTFLVNSLNYIIKLEEKSSLLVFILGVLQIFVGVCIRILSIEKLYDLGTDFISEGLSNLRYAMSCYWSTYFNWSDYSLYKHNRMLESLTFGCVRRVLCIESTYGEKIVRNSFNRKEKFEQKKCPTSYNKILIRVLNEGIKQESVNSKNNQIVDSYLQNLNNQLTNFLIQEIETDVTEHSIGYKLTEYYKIFGSLKAKDKIVAFTNNHFSKENISSKVKNIADEMIFKIWTNLQQSVKSPDEQFLDKLCEGLQYEQYLIYIRRIQTNVISILNTIEKEMETTIKEAQSNKIKQKDISDEKLKELKDGVIEEWNNVMKENSTSVFSDIITKPLFKKCLSILGSKSQKNVKKIDSNVNTYPRDAFQNFNLKKDYMFYENLSISEEIQKEIIQSFNETLKRLQMNLRDPNLYANLLMEKGYMDAICIQAGCKVLGDLWEPRPISLKIKMDSGKVFEFNNPGIGDTRNINIELKNNQFHYEKDDNEESLPDYECLYKAIAQQFPEFEYITVDEFRNEIWKIIETNLKNLQSSIHSFTISRNITKGYLDKNIASTNDLTTTLLDGSYYSKLTKISSKHYLLDLVTNLIKHGDKKSCTNVSKSNTGEYIHLDNNETSVATINNPLVNLLVYIFKYEENLSRTLQDQYRSRISEGINEM